MFEIFRDEIKFTEQKINPKDEKMQSHFTGFKVDYTVSGKKQCIRGGGPSG